MPIEDLVEFINKTGKGHFENPDEVAAAVQKAARSSYRLPKTVTDSVNQVLAVSFAAMKAYKEQLKIFDKAIEKRFFAYSQYIDFYQRHRPRLRCRYCSRNRRYSSFQRSCR